MAKTVLKKASSNMMMYKNKLPMHVDKQQGIYDHTGSRIIYAWVENTRHQDRIIAYQFQNDTTAIELESPCIYFAYKYHESNKNNAETSFKDINKVKPQTYLCKISSIHSFDDEDLHQWDTWSGNILKQQKTQYFFLQ